MHDDRIEEQLRTILRSEGDGLSLTISASELERRLAARRRQAGGRRLSMVAAAIAALAVGSIFALSNGWLRLPAVGIVAPPSASPARTGVPSAVPSKAPSRTPATRSSDWLGSPVEAVLVRPIGDDARPDSFEVTRLDPLTGISVLIASIPGTVLPPDARLDAGMPPTVSLTGWLAIPVERGPTADDVFRAFVVVDLTDPAREPVVFNHYDAISWSMVDGLAMLNGEAVDLAYPGLRDVVRFQVLGLPVNFLRSSRHGGPTVSTQEGSRFLATSNVGVTTEWGSVGYDGRFTATTDLPPIYQRTGLERPAGVAAHTLVMGCDSNGSATAACALVEMDATMDHPVATWVKIAAGESLYDWAWAVDGRQAWLLLDGGVEDGVRVASLNVAPSPGRRREQARIDFPTDDSRPSILGITSETRPGQGALLAIGDDAGFVRAFVTPDGSVFYENGRAWFAGWAGEQPDYDPD